jgi:aminoglycoside phosphotransferase family enzyme
MIKMLREGRLATEMVQKVARRIAEFHAIAETTPDIERFGTLQATKFTTDENFDQTEKYIGITIDAAQFAAIKDYTNRFYRENRALFDARIKGGKVRDCHGDLHMEHICFTDPITIFDCIEFNDRFRYIDTASDIAFLAMDLDFHTRYGQHVEGQDRLSQVLIDSYLERSGDSGIADLLPFYKAYRAYVRGKVISFRLDDQHISAEEKNSAAETAKRYFELSASYTGRGL